MNKVILIKALVETVLTFASPTLMKQVADGILDLIEDTVINSQNKMDDMVVLPLCQRCREVFNVEDDDKTC